MSIRNRTEKGYKENFAALPVIYPGKRAKSNKAYNLRTEAGLRQAIIAD